MYVKSFNHLDKAKNISLANEITYNKTMAMFKYHNLPNTIPCYELENLLQKNGFACVAQVEGSLYAFDGGLGGEPDVYYRPTICTVANPALKLTRDFEIDKDCVIMKNDSNMVGLSHTIAKYNTLLAENEITMLIALINSRMNIIFSGADSATKASAEQYLNMIVQGKLGVISDNAFLESLKIQIGSTTRNNVFEDLIRLNQYLKAGLNNAIGLNSNSAMKKERLITAEIDVNNTALYPLIDDMLECRRIAIEKINTMFETDISVELNSSWDYRDLNGMSIHNTESEISLEDIDDNGDNGENGANSDNGAKGDNGDDMNNENNTDNGDNSSNLDNMDNPSNVDNNDNEADVFDKDNASNENNEVDSDTLDDDNKGE